MNTVASRPAERGGAHRLWQRAVRLMLARTPSADLPPWVRYVAIGAIFVGAALIVTTASIHLHLWLAGYRHVPRLGPLFMAQAITGLIGGPLIAAARYAVFVVGGAIYMASSAVGLILSDTVGFVGIHDTFAAPWAGWALGVEIAGFVILTAAAGLLVYRR
jgi:hypothetical protein